MITATVYMYVYVIFIIFYNFFHPPSFIFVAKALQDHVVCEVFREEIMWRT